MQKSMKAFVIALLLSTQSALTIPQYYCTACNSNYFPMLLNLIGSIHKHNYENIEQLIIFDLGLTEEQKQKLNTIDKCTVRFIELRHPDILKPVRVNDWGKVVPGWYAWKPVALKQALDECPYTLWLDAGVTVLRPLDALFEHIKKTGSFFSSVGRMGNEPTPHSIKHYTTQYVKKMFQLDTEKNHWILNYHSGSAHIMGVSQQKKNAFIRPVYDLTTSLRAFQDDGSCEKGFGYGRYEQVILSIVACKNGIPIEVQDHSQQYPIVLKDQKSTPFYMTYLPQQVTARTHIHHSRGYIPHYNHYVSFIKYKTA